ncbi:Spo0B domain-containing protein [Alicyclobacillus acidocaldarius]|uniref:Spo0B domain-containing protein n=1 Tax=Alicyclobacillus acidocaldarius TaxID=405212 RepID=UPI0002DD7F3E|nr:Spo0B domain-containing protein [Alicyclobacillus acidocaldarius]
MSHSLEHATGLESFRRHRHDVLNQLQIIRALIQMNRADRAIAAMDRLAEWLQSLGRVQQAVGSSAELVVWTLAACPHVVVDDILVEEAPDGDTVVQWISFLTELEERLALGGRSLRMKLRVSSNALWVAWDARDLEVADWEERYVRIHFARG